MRVVNNKIEVVGHLTGSLNVGVSQPFIDKHRICFKDNTVATAAVKHVLRVKYNQADMPIKY